MVISALSASTFRCVPRARGSTANTPSLVVARQFIFGWFVKNVTRELCRKPGKRVRHRSCRLAEARSSPDPRPRRLVCVDRLCSDSERGSYPAAISRRCWRSRVSSSAAGGRESTTSHCRISSSPPSSRPCCGSGADAPRARPSARCKLMLLLRRPGRFPKSVPDYIKDNTWANTWGDVAVYVMMILGLLTTWLFQGIDHLFVGFLFLQAVPEVQKHFWFRPTVLLPCAMKHLCIDDVTSPFFRLI